jgi:hypothetical protein
MTDDPHEVMAATLRRLHDVADVLAAVSAACRLLGEQIDLVELDVIELARLAADTPPKEE